MGWLIAVAVVVLLAALPLGVRLYYNAEGFSGYLVIGPLRFRIYGKNKGKRGTDSKKPTRSAKSGQKNNSQQKGGSFKDFIPLIQIVREFLGVFGKKLRVRKLDALLILAGDDPCDLAVNYGYAWAAVGNLLPQLRRLMKIKRENVQVACDFTAEETQIRVCVELYMRVADLVSLVAIYGIRIMREYSHIVNKRKGGAKV